MIGKKRKRGRIADAALYAPLVLLPFVWFATTACNEKIDKLANPPADAIYNGTPVYNHVDQTRFGSGNQELACTVNGNYIGGGGGNDEGTRAGIQSSIATHERFISEQESEYKACQGKHKSLDQYKAEYGCDESRIRELGRQNSELAARGERNAAIDRELNQITYKCENAQNRYYWDHCQEERQNQRQSNIANSRAALAKDQSNLGQLNKCIADKKRREDAARRPQIDPATMGIIMQGIGRSRPPSSGGHSQPQSTPPPNKKPH
jgi:hypothetical protein